MKTQPNQHVEHSFRQHATRVIALICIVLGCVSVIIPLLYGVNPITGVLFTLAAYGTYRLSQNPTYYRVAAGILVGVLVLCSFAYAVLHGLYGALSFFLMMLGVVVASLTLSQRVAFVIFALEFSAVIPLAIYQRRTYTTLDTSSVLPDTLMAILIAATMYVVVRMFSQQVIVMQGREHAHLKELEVYNTQIESVLEQRLQELEDDISDRTRRLRQLAQRGKELSHVTHDVSNTLTSLRLVLDQNLSSLPENDRKHIEESFEYLRKILQSTTKSTTNHKRQCSTQKCVDASVSLLEKTLARERISIFVEVADRTLAVEPDHLQRIISNFLQNSIDAFSEMNRKRTNQEIRITGKALKDAYVFTVHDNGPGIPEHLKSLVLEPWFSTKGTGHIGMGLSSVSELISLYKGAIFSIDSRPNHYTKMIVSFPL